MKKDLIASHLKYLGRHMSRTKFSPISLSAKLLPLTVYARHESKEDSVRFVKELLQLTSAHGTENVSSNKAIGGSSSVGDKDKTENVIFEDSKDN
jgi:hypothetical protein